MVFLAGPRQVGKTTLAGAISDCFPNKTYFNWDILDQKALLLRDPYFFERTPRTDASKPLVVFDEIHKYKDWKNYLKGIYDRFHQEYRFLVSGSGRLDVYQRGGDSLAGRYEQFHLWPLTVAELGGTGVGWKEFMEHPLQVAGAHEDERATIWTRLMRLSGFPEPYFSGREAVWRRWSGNYNRQLIREDIRDLTALQNIQSVEALFAMLPSKVGSPLSLNVLAQDLKVTFNTVKAWLDLFERFFLIFRIAPWTRKVARAIQKERKLYLFNTPLISDPGARFENAVALELHRAVSNWNDRGLGFFGLHYVRNKEKQEVDFLVTRDHRPFLLVEAKRSDEQPSASLTKFQKALNIPAVQVHGNKSGYRLISNDKQKILVAAAWQWLSGLP